MLKHQPLTNIVIRTFYNVYNELGYGFLERVYQNAMCLALRESGLKVDPQREIKVFYHGQEVGSYFADLLVNDILIVELKACAELCEAHESQLVNYLKATNLEIGLLLNFGPTAEFKRKAWFIQKPDSTL